VIDVDDLLNGHGTQVAGIIAAEKNNDGIGMQGIAPRAKIIPIRAIGVTDGSDILGIQ
jgi:subtilisin family serine protease